MKNLWLGVEMKLGELVLVASEPEHLALVGGGFHEYQAADDSLRVMPIGPSHYRVRFPKGVVTLVRLGSIDSGSADGEHARAREVLHEQFPEFKDLTCVVLSEDTQHFLRSHLNASDAYTILKAYLNGWRDCQ